MTEAPSPKTAPWSGPGKTIGRVFGLLALAMLPSACDEPAHADKNVVRSIKWVTLSPDIAAQQRRIAGIVEPVDVTALSFEVGGRVEKLHVRLGDRVKAGDILAELDREPFLLQVRNAEAEVAAAHAVYKEEVQNLERQKALFQKGWIAQARLDTAVAGHDAAKSQVGARRAQLNLRHRDLKLATLRAPFDGVVSKKVIEAFEQVSAGEPLFELSGERGLKVTLRVPPELINQIAQGQRVTVTFPSDAGLSLPGVVTEIGNRAVEANAFPVTVALQGVPKQLRAGLSAEVVFTFPSAGPNSAGPESAGLAAPSGDSLMVPMWSILSGEGQTYYVFRFDAKTSTVQRIAVMIEDLHDNEVQISGDLRSGDVIAAAGVEFLNDGQTVRLMGAEMPYGAGAEQ
ncbi:efflux RND transporter periplasmic adaptor subunit [Pelagibius sp.]|uniref:efflux RND transporter periplasmic adaptor subunit n=1 Tax=Pelagibius sp. TaxID=1931238 RepID=UPI00262421E9|nr:efflux RND transporter periplasmic adaptor subunit [Pelagibius sp.]